METTGEETYETYGRLIALLDAHGASSRLIDHAPEVGDPSSATTIQENAWL